MNLFHNPLSHAQVFSVLPVTFLLLLTKETINTNVSVQNFRGQEIFLLLFFNGNQIVPSKQPGLPAS